MPVSAPIPSTRPAPLPPRLDRSLLAGAIDRAREALAAWSVRFADTGRPELALKLARGRVPAAGAPEEPWRDAEEDEEACQRAWSETPVARLLRPAALRLLHYDLLAGGDSAATRFLLPGVLRQAPGGVADGNGEVIAFLAPPETIPGCLDELASYVARDEGDPLVTAPLLWYQILAIHPFKDGNGRLARFLAERILVERGAVAPALPLSPAFHPHRAGYFPLLGQIDRGVAGAWERWILFFNGVLARQAGRAAAAGEEP